MTESPRAFEQHFLPDEFPVATEDGRLVGNLATWPFRLALPGRARVAVGGVTWATADPAPHGSTPF